jgi:hypothetical protein
MTDTDRFEFVSELIGGLVKRGCNHAEVCESVATLADALDAAKQAGADPLDFIQATQSKEAVLGPIGNGIPWAAIGGGLATGANSLLNAATDTGSRVIGAVANNAIPIAAMGPLAAGLAGYGSGQLLAQVTDDPSDQIAEIKHQEMLSALRRNAQRLRPDRHQQPPEKPKKSKPAPATDDEKKEPKQ